ncbi:T-cell-interacting, activating receptor on myeloid cells protein 1-like [Equus quagga]|uniref:T-cell-interacting, activating receptor on myeloid cells protein 1-like n=1 Tax=Equus quagga TaxID=89248 RepID=UPI001EE275B3|nr:T-cell-interacting, activating receptor on myeloid cells protein 1-like [Equus quagga]
MFALLKAGSPKPIQLRSPVGKETDFSLQSVTVNDTGQYSCVYYQTKAPFWASEPSNRVDIQVTGCVLAKETGEEMAHFPSPLSVPGLARWYRLKVM